jgi:DNA-binding NarL/FixJ family response regulator
MIAIAVYANDPRSRERLTALASGRDGVRVSASVESPAALARLLDEQPIDVVLTEADTAVDLAEWFADRRAPFVVLVADGETDRAVDAFHVGATAVLPQSASPPEIALAIEAAKNGLSLVPRTILGALLHEDSAAALVDDSATSPSGPLTPRELEVLAAMADGASNKMIARRLGISFHTVKFHVAAILAKLDADSRTEAVAEAARRGLVML